MVHVVTSLHNARNGKEIVISKKKCMDIDGASVAETRAKEIAYSIDAMPHIVNASEIQVKSHSRSFEETHVFAIVRVVPIKKKTS